MGTALQAKRGGNSSAGDYETIGDFVRKYPNDVNIVEKSLGFDPLALEKRHVQPSRYIYEATNQAESGNQGNC